MLSIDEKILARVIRGGRGKEVYFPSDFALYGGVKAVSKALVRLVKAKTLLRLSRGIYFYPQIDKKLGLGALYPSLETIANCVARRDKATVVPTGAYALYKMGFSTQIPMKIVYLTDGISREMNLANEKVIVFRYDAIKSLAYQSELAMLIMFALKELKQDNVTEEHLSIIKSLLQEESKEKVMSDAKLMPVWIKSIILKSYE